MNQVQNNAVFNADIEKFIRLVDYRVDYMLFGVAKEMHSRLVNITPYRTGRARASWNVKYNSSDDAPAPDIGFSHPFLTAAEIRMANTFYDSITASKGRFAMERSFDTVHITNTVHYIEKLNGGSSRQVPAGFFETTVASAPLIARRVANGIHSVRP